MIAGQFGCFLTSLALKTPRVGCNGGVTISLLVITGGMGAGKTRVLAEASDILALRHVAHAAIDLDALGLGFLPSGNLNDCVMYSNLRSVCENYAALGVQRFLLARAIEDRAQLQICHDAVSATEMVVCRLIAGGETMQQRVKMREVGVFQWEYVARLAKLNDILDCAHLEDFRITNENRPLTDVALEMLAEAGWISN
jgi:hypothetical protein